MHPKLKIDFDFLDTHFFARKKKKKTLPKPKKNGVGLTGVNGPLLVCSMFAGFKTNSDKTCCQFFNLDFSSEHPRIECWNRKWLPPSVQGDDRLLLACDYYNCCHRGSSSLASSCSLHDSNGILSQQFDWNKLQVNLFFVRDFWTAKNLRAKNNRSLKLPFISPPKKNKKTTPPSTSSNHQTRGGVAMDVGPTNKMDGLDLMDVFNLLSWKHQAEKISFSQNLVMTGKSNGCSLQV